MANYFKRQRKHWSVPNNWRVVQNTILSVFDEVTSNQIAYGAALLRWCKN